MRETFVQELISLSRVNPNTILITGDLGYGVLEPFISEFPERYINAGISEQTMMGMAGGLASTGKQVFVYSIANFPTLRCLEQIRNDVCLMNQPVCVVSVGAGYAYGPQGYSHHALEDIACMRVLPNMRILIPSDPVETKFSLRSIVENPQPTYLRLGKSKEKLLHPSDIEIDISKPLQFTSGNFGTVLFCGSVGHDVLEAVGTLQKEGIYIDSYSIPDMQSIGDDFLRQICVKGPILTVEEHFKFGGFGGYILERISEISQIGQIKIMGASRKDPNLIGDQDYLKKANQISAELISDYFRGHR